MLLAAACLPVPVGPAIDDAVAKCATATIGGAVIGTLIGGAVGGVGCAVLTALDRQDRERIRSAQSAAAATSQPRYRAYQGADGKKREITIRPQNVAPQVAEGGRICRAVDTAASIAGTGSADLRTALVRRIATGDWAPA